MLFFLLLEQKLKLSQFILDRKNRSLPFRMLFDEPRQSIYVNVRREEVVQNRKLFHHFLDLCVSQLKLRAELNYLLVQIVCIVLNSLLSGFKFSSISLIIFLISLIFGSAIEAERTVICTVLKVEHCQQMRTYNLRLYRSEAKLLEVVIEGPGSLTKRDILSKKLAIFCSDHL